MATTTTDRPARNPAIHLLLTLVADVVAPIGIYYGLRAAGVSDLTALLAGSLPALLNLLITVVRERRLDRLGLFVLAILLLTAVLSLVTDNARALLVRDGWLTGAAGIAFLVTVFGRSPLAFTFSRPLLEEQFREQSGSWDDLWAGDRDFRRIWRISTAIWGVGLLLDAVIRTAMAYTLPIDVVPALNGIQYGVFTVLMLIVTNIQQARAGLWWILAGRPAEPGPRTPSDPVGLDRGPDAPL